MLPQRIMAILLLLPLPALLFVSIPYWITFNREEKSRSGKHQIGYNKFFLALVAIGYFGIWFFWVGGIILLFLNQSYDLSELLICSFFSSSFMQIVGLVILYAGSLFFAWAIDSSKGHLRPSTSGITNNHRLMQNGPLGIVRHPYYVSYVVMLIGLSLTLSTLWPLLLAVCVVMGMVPTAKAEEAYLFTLFGEEYHQYQKRVGQFFPKLFR